MREPTQDLEPVFHKLVPLEQLKPHPRNACIYGDDEDVSDLVDLISLSGWVKPLVVTPSNTIISGHRRWKAAIKLGLETVPCVVREFSDGLAELQALLLENASRLKTNEQKVREGQAWESIESDLARARKLATQNNDTARADWKNFSTQVKDFGRVRDRIALRVGLGSGVTYSKAAKVVEVIDDSVRVGNRKQAAALRSILNSQSIDAAFRVIRAPVEKRQCVLEKIASGEVSVKCGIALLKSNQQPLNPSVLRSKEADDRESPSLNDNQGGSARQKGESECAERTQSDRVHGDSPYKSCWNCHWRGESIDNHTIYCYQRGFLNMVEKDGSQRALECDYWQERTIPHHKADFGIQGEKPLIKYTVYLSAELEEALQQRARATNNITVEKYIQSIILADLGKADSNANNSNSVVVASSGVADDSMAPELLVTQEELNSVERSSPNSIQTREAPDQASHSSRGQN